MIYYKLDDEREPVLCSPEEAFREDNRLIRTELMNGNVVSTVFLYFDHSFGSGDTPLLFETMLFLPDSYAEEVCQRYHTYKEAVEGHWKLVDVHGGDIKIIYDKPLPFPADLFEI